MSNSCHLSASVQDTGPKSNSRVKRNKKNIYRPFGNVILVTLLVVF